MCEGNLLVAVDICGKMRVLFFVVFVEKVN